MTIRPIGILHPDDAGPLPPDVVQTLLRELQRRVARRQLEIFRHLHQAAVQRAAIQQGIRQRARKLGVPTARQPQRGVTLRIEVA